MDEIIKNTPSCCAHVMDEVARKEERRLIRTLFLIGPLLIVCAWLVIVTLHMTVSSYVENEALAVAAGVETKAQSFSENVSVVSQLFLYQLKTDAFILLALSIGLIALIISKSKLISFPYRVREIKKYKATSSQ